MKHKATWVLLGVFFALLSATASARDNISFRLSIGAPGYAYAPAPGYYYPPPPPQVVYYPPPPAQVVYYARPPVVYYAPAPWGPRHGHHRGWRGHRGW